LVAFSIVMPSFLKKHCKKQWEIFPTGIFHLLQAKRKASKLFFYLIGGFYPNIQNKA